ncbi:MAG: hypothetical protein AB4058_03720, partial [Microcystaceae cyanobacterium]
MFDSSSLTFATKNIKIYQKNYQLPVLNRSELSEWQVSLCPLTTEMVGATESVAKQEPMTFEERFQELENLIKKYNKILNQHKQAYQLFVGEFTDELKEIVGKQCSQLAAKAENNRMSGELFQSKQQQLFTSAFILYRAAQLIVQKIKLMNRSIQKLGNEQVEPKDFLPWIDQVDRKTHLESIMTPFFASFQGLIEQVVSVENELSETVEEIRGLAGYILSQDPSLFGLKEGDKINYNMVEFWVNSHN